MRKLFIICALNLGALTMSAQDFTGALDIDVKEMYGVREPVAVHAEYVMEDPAAGPAISEYQWELRSVDPDGNVGEIIYSETFAGDPTGDFLFPEAITNELPVDNDYQVTLLATTVDGVLASSKFARFRLTDFTLTAENEICCGTDITFVLGYGQDLMFAGNTYHYSVTRCDAAGNPTWPLSYYISPETPWTWGQVNVPNSGLPWPTGVQCDTYYRIDVTISNSSTDMLPVTLTKIIYMTSFKMSAQSSYCCGANVTAKATTCPNINVNITNPYHQWQFIPCNAAGTPSGPAVYTTAPIQGINGNTDLIWGGALTCGQYYLLTCLYNNGPTNTIATRNKMIYINPSVQAAVVMTSNTCGVATFSATPTGANTTYTWSAYNNNTPFLGVSPSGSNCSVSGGIFNKVQVVVNQNGCTGSAMLTGIGNTNPNYTGDFNITFTSIDQSYYYIKINRAGSYPTTGLTDVFSIADFWGNAPLAWNQCWSPMSAGWGANIYLFGYNGNYFTYTNNCSPQTFGYPNGRFDKSRMYYIEHYIYGQGCSKLVTHYFSWSGGVQRMGGEGEPTETIVESNPAFGVFPNPGNGSFTILFPEITENAQAELYNMMGERIDAFTFSGDKYEYAPATQLAQGMYMLRITNNGVVSTEKIIVR